MGLPVLLDWHSSEGAATSVFHHVLKESCKDTIWRGSHNGKTLQLLPLWLYATCEPQIIMPASLPGAAQPLNNPC